MPRPQHTASTPMPPGATDWSLPESLQAIVDTKAWPSFVHTVCDELSLRAEFAGIWAIQWPQANQAKLMASAGDSRLLNAVNEDEWTSLNNGELLCLALNTPLNQLHPSLVFPHTAELNAQLEKMHEVLLIPLLEGDDKAWTVIILLNAPLSKPTELAHRLQALWDAQHRHQQSHLLTRACQQAANSMFITDNDGHILWANEAFSALTGYSHHQAMGRTPRFLNSGKHSPRFYRDLWQTIKAGKVWRAESIDKDRYGYLYTIQQTISPVRDHGEITHFLSVHDDISQRKTLQLKHQRDNPVDPVSGLLHPVAFLDQLSLAIHAAESSETPFILASISLRNFVAIGMSLSEDSRQQLLHSIGNRIREQLQRHELASYQGKGDFALLLRCDAMAQAESRIKHLQKVLNKHYPILGSSPYFVFEHGCSRFPDDGSDAETLWRVADGRNGSTT